MEPVIGPCRWHKVHQARPTSGTSPRGRVKAVVDYPYPLLGGAAGSPDDWRSTALRVEQASAGVTHGAVEITVHAVRETATTMHDDDHAVTLAGFVA